MTLEESVDCGACWEVQDGGDDEVQIGSSFTEWKIAISFFLSISKQARSLVAMIPFRPRRFPIRPGDPLGCEELGHMRLEGD